MMRATSLPSRRFWIIGLTLIVSLLLTIVPLPTWLENYRPHWLMLFLIYWSMMLPERVGIGIAWVFGLVLDVLQGTLLGEYALLCVWVTFVPGQLHQRLRLFPLLQQCVFVFLLLGIQFIVLMWIQGISGQPIQGWRYGLSVVTSAWIWPLVYGILNWIQWRFGVR